MAPLPTSRSPRPRDSSAFTLIELLAVLGIVVVLLLLVVPAVTGIKGSGDVTRASYDVAGALDTARAYAKANNTYVWVGFFEENEALLPASPAQAGTGRVTLSVVASKDGTCVYNPNALAKLPAAQLLQVGKLIRLDNAHLAVFTPDGTGTGTNFAGRPAVNDASAHLGTGGPAGNSATSFPYPVGSANTPAQYTFTQAVEFSPRGEARLNNASSGYKPVVEIGLQPTHGTAVDTSGRNPVAIQVTGIVGSVTIYRQ